MAILNPEPNYPLANLPLEVSPGDIMFDGPEHYLQVGLSALGLIEFALDQGYGPQRGISSVLDLPCGHGRVGRVLRARFPHAKMTVCDLERGGVDFCAEHFNAQGVYSTEDFDQLDLGGAFDLIWVGSLITHLDPERVGKFFRAMERHLSADGLLIVSSHGQHVADAMALRGENYGLDGTLIPSIIDNYQKSGFGYGDYGEGNNYGISVISPHWINGFFVRSNCKLVSYRERAWDNHHDVLFAKPKLG